MIDSLQLAPGTLRHSITIEAPSEVGDAAGQPIQTWTPILTTRASIQSTTFRQAAQDNQIVSMSTHEIKLRYPGDSIRIVSGQRVVVDDDTYAIQECDNVQNRNRVLRLTCMLINADSN